MKLPPGPVGGYKKGGRPVKPRVARETAKKQWKPHDKWRPFPKMIRVDASALNSKKVNVLFAGRAARLRNRLRNHPLREVDLPDHEFEILVWKSPQHSIEDTLRSRPPDLRLKPSEFNKAPDEPAVYVWTAKKAKRRTT